MKPYNLGIFEICIQVKLSGTFLLYLQEISLDAGFRSGSRGLMACRLP